MKMIIINLEPRRASRYTDIEDDRSAALIERRKISSLEANYIRTRIIVNYSTEILDSRKMIVIRSTVLCTRRRNVSSLRMRSS